METKETGSPETTSESYRGVRSCFSMGGLTLWWPNLYILTQAEGGSGVCAPRIIVLFVCSEINSGTSNRNTKMDPITELWGLFHKHAGWLQSPASYVSVIDTTYMMANNLHTI